MPTKKELAEKFQISLATIYNWEKTKPELMKVINGYYKNTQSESEGSELLKYFYELDADDQELYLAEIKLKALKKKKEKNK